ncbi:unnamed protein product [Mytilus coruscus]|uniref:Uncharacterized protein n=1 Tax=Mytilus coruscus TaxID=42192 RepID=A0A6J8C8B1_MYTCO|nr:unnamed protein product [Mytilus coruscus]
MYNTTSDKIPQKKMNKKLYAPVPVTSTTRKNNNNGERSGMVALFMDDCSTTSGSCVQSRIMGPSDTYSTVSSEQSLPFHLMSDSSSCTSCSQNQWNLPPYTVIDPYRHYANVPVYKSTTVTLKTVKRTTRKSVWLGLIFGFSIFLLVVLGAVISYGLENGML